MNATGTTEVTQLLLPPAPVLALEPAALDELELLLGGLYAPADGYCLPGRTPESWPAAFSLRVPAVTAADAVQVGTLLLTDPDGTALAALTITGCVSTGEGDAFVAGTLTALAAAEHPPARRLRLTRPLHPEGSPRVLAAFRGEPTAASMAAAVSAAARTGAELWLVAVVASRRPGDYDPGALQALQACAAEIPRCRVGLFVEPCPSPATGPDALGPAGLTRYALTRLGADTVLEFGSAAAGPAPRAGREATAGAVVFFTGLSGAGKSTLARALAERLAEGERRSVTLLDGDDVRRLLSSELGFSMEHRELNVRRIGWVAAAVAKAGGIAICAPIAPCETTRQEARRMAEEVGRFVLVHVATPLAVCEERDRKGLYAKARAGALTGFTGIDSPYEVPQQADLVINTAETSVDEAIGQVLALLD